MKRFYKGLTALALAFTLAFAGAQSVLAVTTDSLNNKSDGNVSIGKVDSVTNTGSFKVTCAGTHDDVKIFQAATMTWNDATQSFDEPQWVPEVTAWLTSYNSGVYAAYTTPAKLGAQSETVQGDFFKAIVSDQGIAEDDWTTKWASSATTGYQNTSVVVANTDTEGNIDSYTITDVPLGIYIAVGNSSTKTYTPAVANLIPQRDPTGKWYLNQNIDVSMKAADVYMHKFINGEKKDIVSIGEDVDFSIDFPLPQYEVRTVSASTKDYTLTFDDELSDSFTLDMNSIIVKYRTSDGVDWDTISYENQTVTDTDGITVIGGILDPKYYSSFIAAPATSADDYGMTVWGCSYGHLADYTIYRNCYKYYSSSGTYDDGDGKGKYDKYYAYYYYRDGAYHLLENSTTQNIPELKGSSTLISVRATPSTAVLNGNEVRALYSQATGDTVNHGWYMYTADGLCNGSSSGADTTYTELGGKTGREYVKGLFHNIFNVTFNYQKLIDDSLYDKNLEIQITYKAQVNQNITVGTETNTNTATMKYETNSTGTSIGSISDTVKAYTYGLNLIKVDGDTVDDTNPVYLENALFHIFKETETFIGTSETDDTTSTYKGSMPGSTTADGLDAASTLSDYKTAHTGDDQYYYYTYTADADATLDNGVAVTTGDVVTRVFKLLTLEDKTYGTYLDGTITSVATAAGVTINGLDEGNYIVSEFQSPDGYNDLAEDMMFSIYKLEDTEAETNYGGSYALFANDAASTDVDDDGIYSLKVLNYAGLTLPSTGGMGTLLFTIIGILLMLLAIFIIIRKGRKDVKNAAGFMAILLAAGIVLTSNPQNVYAFTEVTLNNEYGTLTTGAKTVNFDVELKNAGDQIEVYRIGKLEWSDAENTYVGPEWELGVSQAVTASTEYSTYTTPEELGAADTATQIAFLNWLYENKDSNNLVSNYDVTGKVSYSADQMTATVTGVDYGIYLIKAQNPTTGKNYQLLTVDALPTKEGPLGAWYIKGNIKASLKFSDIAVDKTIDGKDGTTVTTGQTVKFDIIGEVPDYPGVDVTGSDGMVTKDYTGYYFALNDTMSEAFEYDAEKGVTVEYTTDGVTWTPIPEANYTSLFEKAEAGTNTGDGIRVYGDGNGNNYLYCYAKKNGTSYNIDWYVLVEEKGVLTYLTSTTGTSVPTSSTDSTIRTAYEDATGISVTKFTLSSASNWKDVMNVTFDYDYLHTQGATKVRVSYDAKVTTSTVVGTDDNSNTATFYYQKDLSGASDTSSDTAYAWTYAMNLVKKDGDKADTYLAGAKFKLYKEAYVYVPTSGDADKTDSTYDQYKFSANADGSTNEDGTVTPPVGKTSSDGADVELTTLDLLDLEQGGDYYYRYVDFAANECADANCTQTGSEHSHVIAYKLYTYKDASGNDATEVTSVATADGVTITGLSPASYVLIETTAPTGYNKLEEALRFEIQELTEDQAQALTLSTPDGKASLRGFASDETYTQAEVDADSTLQYVTVTNGSETTYYKAYTDGVYPIEVANYAGLVLPSTGGMGTLLFTIIGILLMAAVLVIMIAKRRGAQYTNY